MQRIAVILIFAAQSAFAAVSDDESLVEYDQIVRELEKQVEQPRTRTKAPRVVERRDDPLSQVLFHFGVGATTRTQTYSLGNSDLDINSQGVQAALGIDLLSTHWLSEMTIRKFDSQPRAGVSASLSEFELKIFYREPIANRIVARAGAGLSARYSTIVTPERRIEDVTPTAVATLGLDFYATSAISFGLEGSARSGMIAETYDKSSIDATVRLDAHF